MRRRATAAVLLLLTLVVTLLVNPAPGQASAAAADRFRIRNYKSKLYLQNSPASISNGVEVRQYPRNTTGDQTFQFVADGPYDTFWHIKSNLNMGINNGNT